MSKKIGDKTEPEFWDSLEIKLNIDGVVHDFSGWQAALVREFLIYGAAMTVDGAYDYVTAGGVFGVGIKPMTEFLFKMCDEGILKQSKEPSVKDPDQERLILSSALQPDQFLYQIIIHREDE